MTQTCPALRGIPRPLDVELPRERLVRVLERRWDHVLTTLVAGAGFGKTTALAQAFRASAPAPRGVEAWVSVDPGHEDASRLAAAILTALPRPPEPAALPGGNGGVPGARDVVAALISLAPAEVCVTIDDVHELPAGSGGAALLRELVSALPATCHLVLSGRTLPDLRCARREAAGTVLRLGADELAFTDAEVAALGRRLGATRTTPAGAAAYDGWPALVRLALTAGTPAPLRYVREEILGTLSDAERRALVVLAALGTASDEEIRAVLRAAGHEPCEPPVPRIPLVGTLDDGRRRAHDLWTDAVARVVPPPELRTLRAHAVAALAARGDLSRAGSLAGASGDWAALAELSVRLVRETLTALPRGTAERWLAAVPAADAGHPAFLLLRAAVLHAREYTDPQIDALRDAAWHGALGSSAETAGTLASAVLGQAVVAAHSRSDLARLAALAARATELGASPSPLVRLLRHSVAGVLAELAGKPEDAIAEFAAAPVREVPAPLAVPVLRFHVHCLTMAGRNAEAAALADRTLDRSDDPHTALTGALTRWFGGDPADLDRLRAAVRPDAAAPTDDTAREAFVTRAQLAVIAGSIGTAAGWPSLPAGAPAQHANARDAVLAGAAAATVAIARGDEALARTVYADVLTRWCPADRGTERHLRRFVTLGYVLDERLRAHWDGVDLGPAHDAARAAGRALLDARAGDPAAASVLPPAHALCFLPLPWSVELAARLGSAAHPAGLRLGQWLSDHLGTVVHDRFRAIRRVHTGAARFLTTLPAPPTHRLGISVLGPLRIDRDGVPVEAPELRRLRVRQLLGALVVARRLDRGQVTRLLWPDHDAATAAANLRVTLTHLRRLLEPDRPGGTATYHLRTDGDLLRLQPSEWLRVDLWEADELVDAAGRARRAGDTDRAMELLERAVGRWRSDPLPDLAGLPGTDAGEEAARLRARHVRNLVTLGTLRLVSGHDAEAHRLAGRALALEPFDATGHRLLLAAAIRTGDPGRIAAARRLVTTALAQLAVAPDAPTAALLRQARRR